jgi:hypothetical protein
MIGPKAEGSTVDVELVGDALLGDATGLSTGGLLDGNELGRSLANDVEAAGEEATGALLATEAA